MNNKLFNVLAMLTAGFLFSCGNKGNEQTQETTVLDYPVISVFTQSTQVVSKYPANLEGEQNIEIRPKIDR